MIETPDICMNSLMIFPIRRASAALPPLKYFFLAIILVTMFKVRHSIHTLITTLAWLWSSFLQREYKSLMKASIYNYIWHPLGLGSWYFALRSFNSDTFHVCGSNSLRFAPPSIYLLFRTEKSITRCRTHGCRGLKNKRMGCIVLGPSNHVGEKCN